MEHAKLPWIYADMTGQVVDADSLTVADMDYSEFNASEDAANAAFIVLAVNSHDALVSALRTLVENGGIGPEDMFDDARAALALAGEKP